MKICEFVCEMRGFWGYLKRMIKAIDFFSARYTGYDYKIKTEGYR